MSAEVLPFTGISILDIPPEKVLQAALDAGMDEVVIVGTDADGKHYFASSMASAPTVAWHLDTAKWRLMHDAHLLESEE